MSESFPLVTPPSEIAEVICDVTILDPVQTSAFSRVKPIGIVHRIETNTDSPSTLGVGISLSQGGNHKGIVESMQTLAKEVRNNLPDPGNIHTTTFIRDGAATRFAYNIRSWYRDDNRRPDEPPVTGLFIPKKGVAPADTYPIALLAFRALTLATAQFEMINRQTTTHSSHRAVTLEYPAVDLVHSEEATLQAAIIYPPTSK